MERVTENDSIEYLQQLVVQLRSEKHQLEASYEKALTSLADSEAKRETMENELKLAQDQISTLWQEISQLQQQATNPISPASHFSDFSPELQLQCTNCGDSMSSVDNVTSSLGNRYRDVGSHSETCSVGSCDPIGPSSQPAAVQPDVLLVSVTRTPSTATTWAPFKVVTKSTVPWMSGQHSSVFRSQGDFQWLFEALQVECLERIVPPLTAQISLHATVAEFQRFMSRLSNHQLFRKHHLFVLFLSGSQEEIQTARNKHVRQPQASHDTLQSGQVRDKQTGALVVAKEYLSTLGHNLNGLLRELERSGLPTDSPASYWFRVLSEGEPPGTYLLEAATNLSRVCADMEQLQGENDEHNMIRQNLGSVIDYVGAGLALLGRVEQAVDRFLFWDEEVHICEDTQDDERSAEATGSCQEAKEHLEMMCRHLTSELASFDLQKERELRSIFLEYASLYCEKFQRFQSKWYSINVLVDSAIDPAARAIHFDHHKFCKFFANLIFLFLLHDSVPGALSFLLPLCGNCYNGRKPKIII